MSMLLDAPGASSIVLGRLCDGIRGALKGATAHLPLSGLGVLLPDGPDRAVVTYVDALGATAHRLRRADLPDAVRAGASTIGRLTARDQNAASPDLIDARVLLVGMPARVRSAMPVRQAVTLPLPGVSDAILIAGLTIAGDPTRDHIATLESLAANIAAVLNETESTEEELARLRRLEQIEGVMPTLVPVLDIRQIFARLSEVTRNAIPHDVITVAALSPDWSEVNTYARAGAEIPDRQPHPYPPVIVETFLYHILDDIRAHPFDPSAEGADEGMQSSIGVPILIEGKPIAIVGFSSTHAATYGRLDLAVARRIAEYLGLAMSHQRLAEEGQRATALAERAANLEMLEGLLHAISGALDVREVFERVSEIAKRVLPHDMMALPLAAGDGRHVIVYAVSGGTQAPPPQMIPLSDEHRRLLQQPWEHFLFDDVQEDPIERNRPPARAGFRSLLRVAIRLEGKLVGVLDFGSLKVGFYKPADVLIARRIADHVALVLSHQRLADEIRRTTALEERTSNLEMLDGLLSALTGVLDISEVFTRVSQIASKVLPHDAMALPVITDDRAHVIPFATAGVPTGLLPKISPIPESVKYLVTDPWDTIIVDDIQTDPKEQDNIFAKAGLHSMMRVAIRLDGQLVALLIACSRTIGAYTQTDALVGRRIADHVAMAISHQRLADESRRAAALRERAANLDALDGLLNAVAGVLDVRSVFDRISQIGQTVMPHDAMTIAVRTEKEGIVRLYAATGELSKLGVPMEIPVPDHKRLIEEPWDFQLIDDVQSNPRYASAPARVEGMHSILTMPIRIGGELIGGVNFLSRTPGRFTRDDVPMARRITDHIGLVLSHEQLAEEMRKSEELRARSANIGLLDALLASVTDSNDMRTVFDRVCEIASKVLSFDAMVVPVLIDEGRRIRSHVLRMPEGVTFPQILEVTNYLRGSDWEYDIVEDLQADPRQNATLTALGFRSALRIAIRVEGRLTSGIAFYSFAPGVYKDADVGIGRRVAARIAITLMREQGLQDSKRADEAAERATRLETRVRALTEELNARSGFHRVIGSSSTWRQALTQATQVASTETTVLLLGESGTGKEVVARFVHRASSRKNGPFVALNCAALPEQLLESELFGYERGAFTGAMNARAGKIEQAAGGVLFLDEVGEMSPTVQAKFLRVLQEREFQRLGGSKTLKADARVIAATNRDPKIAMEKGAFREDLYYRLSVFEISLPPLRDRRDDILLLVESFLADLAKNIGRPAGGLSEDAIDRLMSYHWPGNVRELRNAIERAVILCEGGLITSEHLPIAIGQMKPVPRPAVATTVEAAGAAAASALGDLKLENVERDLLTKAMAQAKNNKSQAAKLLGIPRGQFYSMLKRHGLTEAKR